MADEIIIDDPAKLATIFADLTDIYNVADYTDTLRANVVPILAEEHEKYFNEESGPLGPWKPLSPLTVKLKGFDTILIEYNAMRSSLLFDGADHIEDVSPRDLQWGTRDEKSAVHQDGTSRIPQRAFVGVRETTGDRVAEAVADGLVALLKAG